jgi:hypothetical protein
MISNPSVLISIILVNYNGSRFLYDCLDSLNKFVDEYSCEVIIVDNFSDDNSMVIVEDNFPSFKLICSEKNLGFGKANNLALSKTIGKYLLFLNTDTILIENTPKIMFDYLEGNVSVGVAGSRIAFADRTYQLSCGKSPNLVVEFFDKIQYGLDNKWHQIFSKVYDKKYASVQEVEWLTGACMMMRRDVFEQLEGFDENFFMYFEDKDICKRVKELGYKVVYYPKTSIIHLLGGSSHGVKKSVNRYYRESQLYYYEKHLGRFQTAILKLYLRLSGKFEC